MNVPICLTVKYARERERSDNVAFEIKGRLQETFNVFFASMRQSMDKIKEMC